MKLTSIDEVTGNLAIGSVIVAGVSLAVHAFSDVKGFANWLTGLPIWEVLIAVPVLFTSYMIGLLTIRLAAWWFDHRRREGPRMHAERIMLVAQQKSDFVAVEYTRSVRELEVLQGAYPALMCLACGMVIKLFRSAPDIGGRLPWGRLVLGFLGVGVVGVAIVAKMLAKRQHLQLTCLVAAMESSTPEPRERHVPSDSELTLTG